MAFDGNTQFDNEIKPLVMQLLDLCRKNRLPLVLAIGISRDESAENAIVGDSFQTCRVIIGEVTRMSAPMLAAGMMLNEDLASTVRKAVLSHLVSIAAASLTGEGDEDTMEAARIVAAYAAMWRVIDGAGIAARPGRTGSRFERFSPDDSPGAGPFSMEAMERVLRLMGKKGEGNKDGQAGQGTEMPPELYDQLKAMFDDEEEEDKDK
jgi:hypothetical protein